MGSRSLAPLLAAQVALFLFGALAWLAFTKALYANALLCVLAASALAAGVSQRLISGRPLAARAAAPGQTFSADLSRRRLQLLLDQTPSPLLLRRDSDQIIAVNRAARQLFDTPHTLSPAARRALTEGLLPDASAAPIRWGDAIYTVNRAELIEKGQATDLLALTDISADVRTAEATALRDLLRVLNHELMNALTPVASMSRSALDLLRDGGMENVGTAIKALERVNARTAGLQNFINAYRAMTRLPPPTRTAVDIAVWFDVACESFRAQWADKGVILECVPPPRIEILMDEDQMWLAVGNLLNNAAQAALERPEPRVRLTAEKIRDRLFLTIEDSGPGIAADQADKIFMPFYTTKPSGSGVGLSLSRQIIQAHGGALTTLAPEAADLTGAKFRLMISTTC